MGGRKVTAKTIKRKDAPTHPRSRRAHQLQRVALRDAKLSERKTLRTKAVSMRVDRILSLVECLPDDLDCLEDLPALHQWMENTFLCRRDGDLAALQAERRPGRPPLKGEAELRESIEGEKREYSENMEIPDLLNATNVRLLRGWNGDSQAIGLFRLVRISGTNKEQYVRVQDGLHKDFEAENKAAAAAAKVNGEASAGTANSTTADAEMVTA